MTETPPSITTNTAAPTSAQEEAKQKNQHRQRYTMGLFWKRDLGQPAQCDLREITLREARR